jgi:hypothetical protein
MKEVQNHVLTIFDCYESATEYLRQYKLLIQKIKNYQHEVFQSVSLTKDKNTITSIFTKKVEEFLKLDDNFDLLAEVDGKIEDCVEHMCENLVDYQTVDKLTFTDEVVEENKKILLSSMIVKYAHSEKNVSPVNVVGKGIKESTSVNFLRSYLFNRLENKKAFIKSTMRVLFLKEMNKMWD